VKKSTKLIAAAGFLIAMGSFPAALAQSGEDWSDISAATAAAYCLAKHTGVKAGPDGYSEDGFEISSSVLVGAVRRNFVYQRPTQVPGSVDAGLTQTCQQACTQMGKRYEPALVGAALKYAPGGSTLQASGIGDHASIAFMDYDYYKDKTVVSGFWARPQNYHEFDPNEGSVAQADHCCCHAVAPSK
jgi:hypothetical protein